jgi:hypothetical protein
MAQWNYAYNRLSNMAMAGQIPGTSFIGRVAGTLAGTSGGLKGMSTGSGFGGEAGAGLQEAFERERQTVLDPLIAAFGKDKAERMLPAWNDSEENLKRNHAAGLLQFKSKEVHPLLTQYNATNPGLLTKMPEMKLRIKPPEKDDLFNKGRGGIKDDIFDKEKRGVKKPETAAEKAFYSFFKGK